MEVETPLITPYGSTDPALTSFTVPGVQGNTGFLQTSPEYAMKRLIAAGSGDIYQICHAFRREAHSPLHQEEFSLLEWYRVGLDHHGLMDDVMGLLNVIGFPLAVEKASYAALCLAATGLDPHLAPTAALADLARSRGALFDQASQQDRVLLLDWFLGCAIMPSLPQDRAFLIYDFPVEQCAYARVRPGIPAVAERFELVVGEVELANGFHEVTLASEQRARHLGENARRQALGLPMQAIDEALLAALQAGLPACAGVARGLDRLLMLLLDEREIRRVIAFPSQTGV